jgi:hypothetical protein
MRLASSDDLTAEKVVAHADITTSTSARMKQAQARNVSRLSDIMRLPRAGAREARLER